MDYHDVAILKGDSLISPFKHTYRCPSKVHDREFTGIVLFEPKGYDELPVCPDHAAHLEMQNFVDERLATAIAEKRNWFVIRYRRWVRYTWTRDCTRGMRHHRSRNEGYVSDWESEFIARDKILSFAEGSLAVETTGIYPICLDPHHVVPPIMHLDGSGCLLPQDHNPKKIYGTCDVWLFAKTKPNFSIENDVVVDHGDPIARERTMVGFCNNNSHPSPFIASHFREKYCPVYTKCPLEANHGDLAKKIKRLRQEIKSLEGKLGWALFRSTKARIAREIEEKNITLASLPEPNLLEEYHSFLSLINPRFISDFKAESIMRSKMLNNESETHGDYSEFVSTHYYTVCSDPHHKKVPIIRSAGGGYSFSCPKRSEHDKAHKYRIFELRKEHQQARSFMGEFVLAPAGAIVGTTFSAVSTGVAVLTSEKYVPGHELTESEIRQLQQLNSKENPWL